MFEPLWASFEWFDVVSTAKRILCTAIRSWGGDVLCVWPETTTTSSWSLLYFSKSTYSFFQISLANWKVHTFFIITQRPSFEEKRTFKGTATTCKTWTTYKSGELRPGCPVECGSVPEDWGHCIKLHLLDTLSCCTRWLISSNSVPKKKKESCRKWKIFNGFLESVVVDPMLQNRAQ